MKALRKTKLALKRRRALARRPAIRDEWTAGEWAVLGRGRAVEHAPHGRPCNPDCGACDADCGGVFRCRGRGSCGKLVGWCLGGGSDAADPKGTLCADCWLKADDAIARSAKAVLGLRVVLVP